MPAHESTARRERTEFSTTPWCPRRALEDDPAAGRGWAVGMTLAALGVFAILLAPTLEPVGNPGPITVVVFVAAVACWVSGRVDDTFVALAAAAVLALFGVLDADDLFETLGSEVIWLLLAAFVLASGISRTGLPTRLALALSARARSPRQLAHLITAGLVSTALMVPSTSGRAALVLPVFTALASAVAQRERLVKALAVLFPTVVLLSAIGSLVGAGAHLITNQLLDEATGSGISFAQWLLWGLPLAIVSSHVAAEIVLLVFTSRADRRTRIEVDSVDLRERAGVPHRIGIAEIRAGALLTLVIALWSTETWHGLPPAIVALGAALLITSPRGGTVRWSEALNGVPWSLLLFMAATTALGTALTSSGVAQWLAAKLLNPSILLVSVILISVAAHLVLQSRSARSSVLIPLVVPAAVAAGANPVAIAFASTAAAGFCHTLTSSAKPVALFARVPDVPTYTSRDLLRVSALLGPVLAWLVLFFAVVVWPRLGLPLH